MTALLALGGLVMVLGAGCAPLETLDDLRRDFMAQSLLKQAMERASRGQADGRAVQLAAWALDLSPDSLPVLRLATAVFVQGQAWDRGLQGLLALQAKTGMADAYSLRLCYLQLGQEAKGVLLLESLLASERSRHATGRISDVALAVTVNNIGYAYADTGVRLPQALALTQEAVRLDPANATFLDSLGWAHYRLGQHEAAAFALEQALRLQRPPDATIYYHAGVVHARLGRLLLGRSELRRAITLRRGDYPEASEELRRMHWQLPPPETA